MSDNLSTATIPDDCYAVILDAVQRAIIDKYASKATRKAAFSALLALIEAGVVAGETPVSSTARDIAPLGSTPIKTRTLTDLFWNALPVRV
jgi:hypothetical protein